MLNKSNIIFNVMPHLDYIHIKTSNMVVNKNDKNE